MTLSCRCCVLSGRSLCDGLIPRPEESYRVCVCVFVCVRVPLIVVRCSINPLHLGRVCRRDQTMKGNKKDISSIHM